jgi:hypothetical protein
MSLRMSSISLSLCTLCSWALRMFASVKGELVMTFTLFQSATMGTLLVVVYVHHNFLPSIHLHGALDGRRIIYLVSLPVFIGGSVGAALSQSFGVLIGFRILQVSFWIDYCSWYSSMFRRLALAVCLRSARGQSQTFIAPKNAAVLWASSTPYDDVASAADTV